MVLDFAIRLRKQVCCRRLFALVLCAGLCSAIPLQSRAQDAKPDKDPAAQGDAAVTGSQASITTRFLKDEVTLWTAPLRIKRQQLPLAFTFAAGTAALTQADDDIAAEIGTRRAQFGRHASDSGIALFGGAAATFFAVGVFGDKPHARETGRLMGEAAGHAFIIDTGLQAMFRRARPDDSRSGDFFVGGTSFPSNHSAVAWAMASVVANEYPGWGTKALSYGLASAVSLGRVAGRKHFASDVLVGSTLGWIIGRQVYRMNHDRSLPGADWGDDNTTVERLRSPAAFGSPYVPLDSWVYQAFDRLQALGYAPSGFANLRPWTRMECARLLDEMAQDLDRGDEELSPTGRLYSALKSEFRSDLLRMNGQTTRELRLDSLYTRYTTVTGPPLADGYHFGQTLINDYGRPYGRGGNIVSGADGWGSAGPAAFYVRAEYQHAAELPAYSDSVQKLIATVDNLRQAPVRDTPRDQVRLLDAYAAWNFRSVQVSVGRQSLWWGPNRGGPLMYSNNADPMDMIRVSKTSPAKLPSFLGLLGPMRWDFFFGMMADHHFPADPAIHGQKISFKPTPNLEFGFSRTLIFKPVTLRKFMKGFVSVGSVNMDPGAPNDPGDRRGGFDFSYRIPGLRKWLIIYNDAMTDDDPSPLSAPRRSIMNPGIYLPQIPKIPNLDLRVEAPFSDTPFVADRAGRFFYYNGGYRDAYTNGGELLGSWIGRQGRGLQVWSTYWLSPRNKLEFGYRHARVAPEFIPAGGQMRDFSVRTEFVMPSGFEMSTYVQHERWSFPVLATGKNSNTTASVQLTYRPGWGRALPPGRK
jgi:hypothetical protein